MTILAAEYVRMSTEHQQYSADNQLAAISRYAEDRGFKIIRTFADRGRSGLTLSGRPALKQLFEEIDSGTCEFAALLIYDVSRFGRFPDPDEAASCELRCRRAGVAVHYCAEQFENDGSISSSLLKALKRVMASEYSRELSSKVYAGQVNLLGQGFRVGSTPGIGLRRVLVDRDGKMKGELRYGEQKSIATDRVVLAVGPEEETETVRQIFDWFISGIDEREIAKMLNHKGIVTDRGRYWTYHVVRRALRNESYIGNLVWGKKSYKLRQKAVQNPRSTWHRRDGVIPPIIDKKVFDLAQTMMDAPQHRFTEEELLQLLRDTLGVHGRLSGVIIDGYLGYPNTRTFQNRFGSLLKAYDLIGYVPPRCFKHTVGQRRMRCLRPTVLKELISGIRAAGGTVEVSGPTRTLRINAEFSAEVKLVFCTQRYSAPIWKLTCPTENIADMMVFARMTPGNEQILDYYIMPSQIVGERRYLRTRNDESIDRFRADTPEPLFALVASGDGHQQWKATVHRQATISGQSC